MIFRAKNAGWEPFYKFKEPCKHNAYRPGDSWTEELGFSRAEFDNAMKIIGTKLKSGMARDDCYGKTDATGFIIYWTDSNRTTWYHVNRTLLDKVTKSLYLEDQQSRFSRKSNKVALHDSETTRDNTETKDAAIAAIPSAKSADGITYPSLPQKQDREEGEGKEEGAVVKAKAKRQKKKKGKKAKEGEKKVPTEHQLAFGALAKACAIDYRIAPVKVKARMEASAKMLLSAGYTPDDISAIGAWWYEHDWRGQKGQAPTPEQIREVAGKWRNGNGNGRVLSPEEQAHREEMRRLEAATLAAIKEREHGKG